MHRVGVNQDSNLRVSACRSNSSPRGTSCCAVRGRTRSLLYMASDTASRVMLIADSLWQTRIL